MCFDFIDGYDYFGFYGMLLRAIVLLRINRSSSCGPKSKSCVSMKHFCPFVMNACHIRIHIKVILMSSLIGADTCVRICRDRMAERYGRSKSAIQGDTQKLTEIQRDLLRHVEIHRDTQRGIDIFRDLERHVETYRDIRRHLKVHDRVTDACARRHKH